MDALKHAESISKIVSQGRKRKYYRFRSAPYYGGIATADCVGCCLKCIFCWSWNIINRPEHTGKYYSPEFVANQLIKIARRYKYNLMRVSGNEPTLNREHLIALLSLIPNNYQFILETNGILLGNDRGYCKELAQFPNLHVRVSLKGCNEQDFEHLTGMDGSGFGLQIKALENLKTEGASCHSAVMYHFSKRQSIEQLHQRLAMIGSDFRHFEMEELILYPAIEERLRKFSFID